MIPVSDIKHILKSLYNAEGVERIGFIAGNMDVVEVNNVSSDPIEGYEVSDEDLIKYQDAKATWHTHPGVDSNLSGKDYEAFRAWPDMYHFIIGNDGVKAYKYDATKKVVLEV